MPKSLKISKQKVKNNLFEKFIVIISVVGVLFGFTALVISLAKNGTNTPSPISSEIKQFPIDKLEVKNIQWGTNVFQAEILNKNDKPVYDIQMIFKTSKTREVWDVDENYNYTVPYKIDPGQTIKIKVTGYTTKKNPWSTAWILSAKYYNGESIPTLPPTPTPKVYVNPDPVTDCVSSYPNCNGESIRLKKSQCSNITCCQVGSTWSVYSSTEKCKAAQNSAQPTQQVQKPTAPTNQLNYYCYDNTNKYWYYTSSGEQCNIDNMVSMCKGIIKSTYDLCMKGCLDTANSKGHICVVTYAINSPDLYKQCEDQVNADMKTCDDACAVPYVNSSTTCHY